MKISETSNLQRLLIIRVRIKNINASLKILQSLINKNSRKQYWNINVWKTSTNLFFLITNVCIEISLILQNLIKETSMKQPWNISYSETSKKKHKWSLSLASTSSMFHQGSLREASTKHHWNSKEKSMFRRLAHLKQNISDQLISSRSRQCFINVPPTNHQWRGNDSSVFWRLAQKNLKGLFCFHRYL